MRYYITLGFAVVCTLGVSAQNDLPGYRLEGSVSLSTPVSARKMTNLIFPVAVASAVKVSNEVKMYRPKGIRNVIELKAVRRNFRATNITVYGINGTEYSFALYFVEDTSTLNFHVVSDVNAHVDNGLSGRFYSPIMFSGIPVEWTRLDSDAVQLATRRPYLKTAVSIGGLQMRLNGVYLRDSLLWLTLTLHNRVHIGFTPSFMRIYLEDRKQIKRTASQQVTIKPIYPAQLAIVPGMGTEKLAAGLIPFVPAKGKRLVVELSDADGGRVLILKIKGKKILGAREAWL